MVWARDRDGRNVHGTSTPKSAFPHSQRSEIANVLHEEQLPVFIKTQQAEADRTWQNLVSHKVESQVPKGYGVYTVKFSRTSRKQFCRGRWMLVEFATGSPAKKVSLTLSEAGTPCRLLDGFSHLLSKFGVSDFRQTNSDSR